MTRIGTVGELRRYPVKSMLGETLERADVHTRALSGDRVCALIDVETGRVASAKMPGRWRRLLECAATYHDDSGAVGIVISDGRHLDPTGPDASDALSALLDRPVRFAFVRDQLLLLERADPVALAAGGDEDGPGKTVIQIGMRAPEGGFFDAFPIHFITTASLKRVAGVAIAKAPEPARFRPNIVIDSVGLDAFAENAWDGALISIGRNVRLRVAFPTPRCAVPTLGHGAIAPDPQLTVEIGRLNRAPVLNMGPAPCLGAYAQIERPGRVALGDEIYLE